MQYLLFIPTTVMDKVFHLLVLYGNLYTLEQRRRFSQYQREQRDLQEFCFFSFQSLSMQSFPCKRLKYWQLFHSRKFSNTHYCLFTDLEGLGKQATLLSYPKGHLHSREGSKTPEDDQKSKQAVTSLPPG